MTIHVPPHAVDATFSAVRGPPNGRVNPLARTTDTPLMNISADVVETLITTGYGYGMFTGIFAGQAAHYHPGDNPGYQSFSVWLPDLAASLVVLANDDSVNMTGLLRQLLPIALDG